MTNDPQQPAAEPASDTAKPVAPASTSVASKKPATKSPAKPQTTKAATKPKAATSKPKAAPQTLNDAAVSPAERADKQQAAAEKARQAKAKLAKIAANKAKAKQKPIAPAEPVAVAPATGVSPGADAIDTLPAAEKARQAKAKLAKIAAHKAKVKKAPPAVEPVVAAAINAIPALEVAPVIAPDMTASETNNPANAAPDAAIDGIADQSTSANTGAQSPQAIPAAPKTQSTRPLSLASLRQKLPHYLQLMRLDKPIGTLLLLWPTLWALWLAAKGVPSLKNLVIFSLGVLLMRSAGCVINDFADRKIDGQVARTRQRPLATGAVTSREALILFVALCLTAFGLVLCTDALTIKLSFGGLLLAASYPFMKRHTHLPQVVLGAAFAWGIPMAYAAEIGKLDKNMWVIYLAVVLWTVAYDTFYAMVDRADDLKIGVKSTAILFGEQDRVITGTLQAMMIYAMVLVGKAAELGWIYYLGLAVAAGLFIYQQWLIRFRERDLCFKAFLNNNWVGAAIFVGIAGDLALK